MKFILSATVLILIGVARLSIAAPYTLPTDSGWYQLQSTITFETECQTGDPQPCEVDPGSYVLLNHNASNSSGQPVRTTVTIEQEPEAKELNFLILTKTCTDETNCQFACINDDNSRQGRLLSGHCSALDNQFQFVPTFFQLKAERLPNDAFCSTNESARITLQITCIYR